MYDNLGRILSRTYPDTGVESFGYSARGLVLYANQLGFVTTNNYDAGMRKTSETNANGEPTLFTYDADGDLLTLTDGKNQTTTWHYDVFGLVSNKVDAASNVILVYHYDANNRLTNRWSAAKTNTYYSYDAVGNLTNIAYPVSSNISFAYDAINELTNMIDGVGVTGYGYDTVGQLLSETGPWNDDMVSYGYSGRLRARLGIRQPDADAWNQTYAYDGARRLTNITTSAGAYGYQYDVSRKLQVGKLAFPNSAYITNAYDSVTRLLSTALKNSGGTTLNSHSYTYNVGNQRTEQVFTAGNFVDYTYDRIGQVTTALGKESGGVTNRLQEQLKYAYDAAHNLSVRTNNALIQSFNVNSLNELSNVTRNTTNALTVAGTTTSQATSVTVNATPAFLYVDFTFASSNGFTITNGNNSFTAIAMDAIGRGDTNVVSVNLPATNSFAYDLNGNLLSDGTRAFDYDDENQLIQVTVTNAWKSEFGYDGKMRRRIRKEFTWQYSSWIQTNEVRYVYDGNLVVQERDINNLPTVTYTRGKDLSGSLQGAGGIGGLLARRDRSTGQTAFYLADVNVYRFSSKEWHANSGLVYYLYRYYNPITQRWLNRDPLQMGYDVNNYCFAANNSISSIDPLGLVIIVVHTTRLNRQYDTIDQQYMNQMMQSIDPSITIRFLNGPPPPNQPMGADGGYYHITLTIDNDQTTGKASNGTDPYGTGYNGTVCVHPAKLLSIYNKDQQINAMMQFVILHEILHAMGAEHTDAGDTTSIMNPGIQSSWFDSPPVINPATRRSLKKLLGIK